MVLKNRLKQSNGKSRENRRNAVLWNTASGMINAGQSAVILIFISHFLDRDAAGVFTIAYAFANLFFVMAKYGTRNYQVTDTFEKFSFHEYLMSRIVSCIGVGVLLLVYLGTQIILGAYDYYKAAVILMICLWKFIDSVEDIYYGMYQQKGRLDIGARCYTLRLIASSGIFCVLILFKIPLLWTSLITLVISIMVAFFLIRRSYPQFIPALRKEKKEGTSHVGELLKICFPLFIGTSLSTYVGNSPKYMIDWYLDEKTQAIFGYIMMPAFIILVLNQVIYQPIIKDLGDLWASGEKKKFVSRVGLQYLMTAGITGVVVLVGSLIGIPALSILYNTDLFAYKSAFIVLLAGGGFYAVSSFLMVPLTTIRFHQCIAIGFAFTTVVSLVLGKYFVVNQGVMGAALLYLILNIILMLFFTACFFIKVTRKEKREPDPGLD